MRLSDVTPGGRMRVDAVARFLQDVSNDDTRDAQLPDAMAWVVRRTVLVVRQAPVYDEELDLATWCGGVGGRWAERRVAIAGGVGAQVEAAVLWIHLDQAGRPRPLPEAFLRLYGEAAGGRKVGVRLTHPDPPPGAAPRRWPLRLLDVDVLGHVNNAAYWTPVDEELARRRDLRAPLVAEAEYRAPVEPGDEVDLHVEDGPASVALWWCVGGEVRASLVVRRLPSG